MSEIRDSIYYAQLARAARRMAAQHSDPVASRHLREAAIRHDRTAKELAREERAAGKGRKWKVGDLLRKLR